MSTNYNICTSQHWICTPVQILLWEIPIPLLWTDKIDYEKNNDGVFVVSDLQKSKDFKLTGKEIGSQDIDIVYDYTILPQDYIQ